MGDPVGQGGAPLSEHVSRSARLGPSGRFSPPAYGFRPVENRVFRSLIAGPAQRVTTLVAPTGFGKTVLMTQLFTRYQKTARCLWLGLDDQPVDLPGLLTQIEDLLGLPHAGDTAPMMVDMRADNPARIEAILHALTPDDERDVVLFLDNLNSCDDPDLRLFLDALVFRAPRGLRLFMTSTRAIPFDSIQAMLELKLRRIGPMELSFDREDTMALLEEAGVDGLSDTVIAHFVDRSEGWPAAIRLMQILVMGQGERGTTASPGNAAIDEPGAMDGDIAALLSRKLVQSFPEGLTHFLMQISVLRRFSVELAEAATGNPDSRMWIDHLVERNVLIVPVSPDRLWWRFHALFREFLVREAARALPETMRRQVAARAANWLAATGEPEQALDMALVAQDGALAVDLLERLARPMVRDRGDLSGFLSLVARSTAAGVSLDRTRSSGRPGPWRFRATMRVPGPRSSLCVSMWGKAAMPRFRGV